MKKGKKRVLIGLLVLVLAIVGGAYGYSHYLLGKVNQVDIAETDEELGISSENQAAKSNVTNILLLGVDKQENASDTMIVLSINEDTKAIKLTSIMRDSKVDVGTGYENKLNYAYHFGGATNTIKVINEHYALDIRDYVKVDFDSLADIIDYLGGVDITIKDNELEELNKVIKNSADKLSVTPTYVKNSGKQHLNGLQALSYSRIRKNGTGDDFKRTERQRTVLTSLLNSIKNTSPTKYPTILSKIAPLVESSLSSSDMMGVGQKVVSYGGNGVEQTRLPLDDTWKADQSTGVYVLLWDRTKNLEYLHNFIYGDTTRLTNIQQKNTNSAK